ncbi:MAG TPA: hypothetical protein VF800_02455 [Telluria sp.]|jgi:hypothetical protein
MKLSKFRNFDFSQFFRRFLRWPAGGGENAQNPHGCSLLPGLLLAIFMLLTPGCTSSPPLVQEVKIPVYRSCVTEVPARPTFGTRTLAPDASNGEKILALARDLPVHLKYEAQLEAVIAGCL